MGEVRALRSLAWMSVDDDTDAYDEHGAGEDHHDQEGAADGTDRRRARALMERALDVLDGSDEPQLRYERAQTWLQLAQLLDDGLGPDDEDDEDDDLDEEGDGDGAVSERDPAADAATREEMVRLLDRAAAAFAEFGEAALRDRVQCLVRAAWTERALGRAGDGASRLDALVGELKELGNEAADGLLRHAEYVREQLARAPEA
ncbi:hypothetical protein RB196_10795 [Streptomyces sp. PmtA]|uniref:hypothetical protein n=1 Tax=Streptomyces sp. PmtA TaxID=3074275 RepID=UPI003014CFBF